MLWSWHFFRHKDRPYSDKRCRKYLYTPVVTITHASKAMPSISCNMHAPYKTVTLTQPTLSYHNFLTTEKVQHLQLPASYSWALIRNDCYTSLTYYACLPWLIHADNDISSVISFLFYFKPILFDNTIWSCTTDTKLLVLEIGFCLVKKQM